jgi:hypothetical protein
MAKEFNELIGKELAGIGFVRDYIEITFDGPILRYFVLPVLKINNELIDSKNINWRNSLCLLIGDIVTDTVSKNDIHIEIIFKSGKKLIVDMVKNPPRGEMLNYLPYSNGPISVW